MANITRSISSKQPKWAKQEIPTGKKPKSGRSRTKLAKLRWEQEKATDSRDGSSR